MGGDHGGDLRGRPTPWLMTPGGGPRASRDRFAAPVPPRRARPKRHRSPTAPASREARVGPNASERRLPPPLKPRRPGTLPSPTPRLCPAPSCICRCAGDEWASELSVSSRTCWLRAPGARALRAEAGTRRRSPPLPPPGGSQTGSERSRLRARARSSCALAAAQTRAAPPRPRPPPPPLPLPALGGRAGAGRPGRAGRAGAAAVAAASGVEAEMWARGRGRLPRPLLLLLALCVQVSEGARTGRTEPSLGAGRHRL